MAIAFKHHYKSDSLIGTGTIKFLRYSITSPLSISYALTNCTADSTNPTEIVVGKTYDFGFTADSGYEFTGSGTTSVSGGTIVAWDYPDTSDLTRITVAIEVTGNLTITQIASVALPQLATPQNVSADGTTVSWDEVGNATSYAVLADGSEIGTVEGQPILITFTIGGTSYQAEEGMTWGEWVESSYNTISSTVAPDGKITFPPNGVGNYIGLTDNSDNDKVVSTDIIIAQMQYYGQNSGGR